MALERLDGTFSAGANISIGKARTAVMFKKPTRFFEELLSTSSMGPQRSSPAVSYQCKDHRADRCLLGELQPGRKLLFLGWRN